MKKRIEFGELKITDLAKKHIQDCLDTNQVSAGPKVKLFEEKWAKIFNYPYTTMVSSGTSAVTASCMALYEFGFKPGDYVICPALSFIATANAIRAAGFTPYFVDIKKETLNIDEELVADAIYHFKLNHMQNEIAGIIGVNLMGNPCQMDALHDMAFKLGCPFIVDNCEGYGCHLNGKFSLEYADFECTSHYIAHIICSAEGGTVSTKDPSLNKVIRSIRSHGRKPDDLYFDHCRYGLNLKPTDLNASIGLGEIDDFWKIFVRRKEILYRFYGATEEFSDKFYFVQERAGCLNAPHGFSITAKEQSDTIDLTMPYVKSELDKAGIHWKKNFGSMPGHLAFDYHGQKFDKFPNAEYVGENGIHIGCHYWLSDEDVNYVCESLRNILKAL